MAGLLDDEVTIENLPWPYNPGNPSLLNAFPHESNFGQGLSGPHVFPTSRLGTTVPVGDGDNIAWTDDYGVTELAEEPADTRGEYNTADRGIQLSTGIWRGAHEPPLPILNSGYSYRNKPESVRYGIGGPGNYPMGFDNWYLDPWVPSKEDINPLTGHPKGAGEMYTDRREEFTRTVPSHEAAHRSIIEQLFPQWKAGRGEEVAETIKMPSNPDNEEEFEEWLKQLREGLFKERTDQHEIIYLQDWIASKLANDTRGMKHSESWLNSNIGGWEKAYNIEENLQPGTPTRVMLEELNDLANIELQKQGRPPILNYKDMINEAIGYEPPKSLKEYATDAKDNILNILKNVGRK